MTRTVKQAQWDLYKEQQRAERVGLRAAVPVMTPADRRGRGQAERATARRRAHRARKSQRTSAEHHRISVESKRAANS
jgi:hypothetical protein